MRIGVFGAGNMADALATQWARAGHEVMIGARVPARAEALASRIGVRAGTLREAARFGEAVLLAVMYPGVHDVLAEVGPLEGRVLIDCTNTFANPDFAVKSPNGAKGIAAAVPGAHVVKAFNLCHESVWRRTPPEFDGRPLGVPLCGDDRGALKVVEGLVRDLGCEPLRGGGLDRAGQLEATAAFVVGLYVAGDDPATMLPPLEFAIGEPRPADSAG
ncbi:NADPH-dependent F420 reductase [Spirillospora sp. CA-294931]|uniref:NADPH-dependent F420 reductase n=1 Tax=Spirillospora sp. CA-294931 TaxID=3240042 RepID=UPI003D918149